MENSVEEDIAKVNTYIELVLEKDYCNCNELNTILGKHCDGSKNVAYAMQHILSEYKRVLKENEELRERVKELEEENQQLEAIKDEAIRRYNLESIPTSLVKEKIEEINKAYEDSKDENGESQYYYPDYTIRVLEELLEKRK